MNSKSPENASFMMQNLFERQRELKETLPNANIDPFFLLKEAAEMSDIRNLGQKDESQMTMKQLEARNNYNNMVMSNYDKDKTATQDSKFDPLNIEERMKKLKFAKKENIPNKDTNWFKRMQEDSLFNQPEEPSKKPPMKNGLTEEDERQIHREMIPVFIAKQQELQPQYEHIQSVGQELKELKEEFNVVIKQAKPQATTSFMSRRGSQAKQYDLITNQMRHNRIQRLQERQNEQMIRSGSRSRAGLAENFRGTSPTIAPSSASLGKRQITFLQPGSDTKNVEEDKISEETVSDVLKNSENSQISAYKREKNDERICKFCEFFGCEGQCDQAKAANSTDQAKKRAIKVKEEGIEYVQNEYGLIDLKNTEKLFINRKNSNISSEKDDSFDQLKDTGVKTGENQDRKRVLSLDHVENKKNNPNFAKRTVNTAQVDHTKTRKQRIEQDQDSKSKKASQNEANQFEKFKNSNRFSQPQIGKILNTKKSAFMLNPLNTQQNFAHYQDMKSSSQNNINIGNQQYKKIKKQMKQIIKNSSVVDPINQKIPQISHRQSKVNPWSKSKTPTDSIQLSNKKKERSFHSKEPINLVSAHGSSYNICPPVPIQKQMKSEVGNNLQKNEANVNSRSIYGTQQNFMRITGDEEQYQISQNFRTQTMGPFSPLSKGSYNDSADKILIDESDKKVIKGNPELDRKTEKGPKPTIINTRNEIGLLNHDSAITPKEAYDNNFQSTIDGQKFYSQLISHRQRSVGAEGMTTSDERLNQTGHNIKFTRIPTSVKNSTAGSVHQLLLNKAEVEMLSNGDFVQKDEYNLYESINSIMKIKNKSKDKQSLKGRLFKKEREIFSQERSSRSKSPGSRKRSPLKIPMISQASEQVGSQTVNKLVYNADDDIAAFGQRILKNTQKSLKAPNALAPAVKKHKFKESVKNQKHLPQFIIYNENGSNQLSEQMSTGGLMQGRKRKQSALFRQGKIKQIVAEKSEKLHHQIVKAHNKMNSKFNNERAFNKVQPLNWMNQNSENVSQILSPINGSIVGSQYFNDYANDVVAPLKNQEVSFKQKKEQKNAQNKQGLSPKDRSGSQIQDQLRVAVLKSRQSQLSKKSVTPPPQILHNNKPVSINSAKSRKKSSKTRQEINKSDQRQSQSFSRNVAQNPYITNTYTIKSHSRPDGERCNMPVSSITSLSDSKNEQNLDGIQGYNVFLEMTHKAVGAQTRSNPHEKRESCSPNVKSPSRQGNVFDKRDDKVFSDQVQLKQRNDMNNDGEVKENMPQSFEEIQGFSRTQVNQLQKGDKINSVFSSTSNNFTRKFINENTDQQNYQHQQLQRLKQEKKLLKKRLKEKKSQEKQLKEIINQEKIDMAKVSITGRNVSRQRGKRRENSEIAQITTHSYAQEQAKNVYTFNGSRDTSIQPNRNVFTAAAGFETDHGKRSSIQPKTKPKRQTPQNILRNSHQNIQQSGCNDLLYTQKNSLENQAYQSKKSKPFIKCKNIQQVQEPWQLYVTSAFELMAKGNLKQAQTTSNQKHMSTQQSNVKKPQDKNKSKSKRKKIFKHQSTNQVNYNEEMIQQPNQTDLTYNTVQTVDSQGEDVGNIYAAQQNLTYTHESFEECKVQENGEHFTATSDKLRSNDSSESNSIK